MGRPLDLSSRKRAWVRPDGSAPYRCSECGEVTILRPETRVRPSTPVRVAFHCVCGTAHAVYVHCRAARTEVNSRGQLINRHTEIRVPVQVRNLSRTGLLLEFDDAPSFAVGEELLLRFDLDHVRPGHFTRKVAVRRIAETQIGAEFAPDDDPEAREFEHALAQVQLGIPGN